MNIDSNLLGFMSQWAQLAALWGIGFAILTVLIHIVFAVAVYRDAIRLDRTRALIIVGPAIWGIATLIGGVITAAIYWAMHHSRLNPDTPIAAIETTETEEESA